MNKETSAQSHKSNKVPQKNSKDVMEKAEALLPNGSWQRVAVGVAAAASGGLLAAAIVGVGPAALAGAAGYLAYRGLNGQSKNATDADFQRH